MNKKILILYILSICAGFTSFAQIGKKNYSVTLIKGDNSPAQLPYIGEKTCVLFYIDPDVQELSDPLTEAVNNKKYPKNKFGAIGVVNCKDTWIPNSTIRSRVASKQTQYPESVLFLDEDYILKSAWKTGDANNVMIVYVIGKDASILFSTTVKTEQETKSIIPKVIQAIESNLE